MIRQRQAESDPANAEWQRDLAVSHYKLAKFAQQSGDDAGFEAELRECFRAGATGGRFGPPVFLKSTGE